MVLLNSAFVPDIFLIPSPALAYESEEETPVLSSVIANSLLISSTSKCSFNIIKLVFFSKPTPSRTGNILLTDPDLHGKVFFART